LHWAAEPVNRFFLRDVVYMIIYNTSHNIHTQLQTDSMNLSQ